MTLTNPRDVILLELVLGVGIGISFPQRLRTTSIPAYVALTLSMRNSLSMPLARFSKVTCRLRGSQCAACAVLNVPLARFSLAACAVLNRRGGRATGHGLRAREQHRAASGLGAVGATWGAKKKEPAA